MTALFIKSNLSDVKSFLFRNSIDYELWNRDSENEIRVELINDTTMLLLKNYFKIDNIENYSYIIFWN